MTSRSAIDDHAQHQPGRGGAREAALDSDDALDAALADLSAAEAQALRWLVRRADGLGAAAEAELRDWLGADPAHPVALDDMTAVWQGLDDIPADGVARLQAAASAPGPAVAVPALAAPARSVRRSFIPSRFSARIGGGRSADRWTARAVAACMVFALVGGGWVAWDAWWQQPVFSQHLATARGQQLESRLPDGSTLRLDTASQADVVLYRQRREVHLPEGQIMFAVQGDEARPFDVLAGAMRITVVGTRFSVRYTPSLGGNQVQVAVEEGRVRVARASAAKQGTQELSTASADDAIVLGAGQTVAADGQGRLGPVGRLAAGGLAPWRGNRVNFDNTPLATAVAELERYGNTGLLVRDPVVGALPVTGSVDLRRLEDFTRSLAQVLPVRLEPHGGKAEVVPLKP